MSTRRPKADTTRFRRGTGNVFADLDLPQADEALVKARLAEAIEQAILRRDLTQEAAGRIMSVDQGTVSKLVNGRLDGFSQERLIRYLTLLGDDVEIVVRPSEDPRNPGRLRVTVT